MTTHLSVLALSSRFDGLLGGLSSHWTGPRFQYSLCRVVLMVSLRMFQFCQSVGLSVLALSSRFDGPVLAR